MGRLSRLLSVAAMVALVSGCSGGPGAPSSTTGTSNAFLAHWPVSGVEGEDWVINNYVDLDPGPGIQDYRGGDKAYDGHRGIDVDIPNFRWIDTDRVEVLAAAAGRVVDTHDGEPDRNISCVSDQGNDVVIEHANRMQSIYGHLKNGSVSVSVGEQVAAGQKLGIVGSSGCSTAPHLHFELVDRNRRHVDPFHEELWTIEPPQYDPPLTLMDYGVKEGRFSDSDFLDPPPNIETVPRSSTIGIVVSLAGGREGEVFRIVLTNGGSEYADESITGMTRHSFYYFDWRVPDHDDLDIVLYVNDEVAAEHHVAIQ